MPRMVARTQLVGAAFAVAAFGWWGAVPLYWRTVRAVPAGEMVAHRVVWALPVLWLLLARGSRIREVVRALKDARHRTLLIATALLVGSNWLVFIVAVQSDRVLESSLGYYVNPLVNVLLGTLVLGERLSRRQTAAVAVATLGVTWLAVSMGTLPWIALVLAFTFGFYGLLRKMAGEDALVGLAVETVLLLPLALAALVVLVLRGEAAFLDGGPSLLGLVAISGVVTALPLLWFAHAARRLRFATIGFFQYLSPTGQFLLAVFVFGERFTDAHAVAFTCIGIAAALYLWGIGREPRVVRGAPVPPKDAAPPEPLSDVSARRRRRPRRAP
jgi:chloramphenicol-sensitive protein RarD